ncbi:MAG TPA: ankyrin repeat domain-containing protein [Gemmatimonadaceae bacterium]|nr:ankyrin repeat domain-containing protein [Gemmatimonadaceae bacterium]
MSVAPSAVLSALYSGDRDAAREAAGDTELTLPELAAFGDVPALADRVARRPDELEQLSPDGWTALHLASWFGYSAAAVRLLRSGASHATSSRNAQGNTALHAAIAGRCDMPVITALLAAGSDPVAADAQGYVPLHLAASRGDQAVCELLIACGASPDTPTSDGRRAVDLAREHLHLQLATLLTPD